MTATARRARCAPYGAGRKCSGGGAKRFYPRVPKAELFARGYIAAHSRHSAGIAVDLTLIKLPARKAASFDRAAHYGPCTGPAAARAPDNSIDMGTGFDCFDRKSYTRSAAVTPTQRRWRLLLKAAMTARGFRNYFREWWHYEFSGAPLRTYDFPIVPAPRALGHFPGQLTRLRPAGFGGQAFPSHGHQRGLRRAPLGHFPGQLTIYSSSFSSGTSFSLAATRPRTETPASCTVAREPDTSGCHQARSRPSATSR